MYKKSNERDSRTAKKCLIQNCTMNQGLIDNQMFTMESKFLLMIKRSLIIDSKLAKSTFNETKMTNSNVYHQLILIVWVFIAAILAFLGDNMTMLLCFFRKIVNGIKIVIRCRTQTIITLQLDEFNPKHRHSCSQLSRQCFKELLIVFKIKLWLCLQ